MGKEIKEIKYTEKLFSDTGPIDKKKIFEAIKDFVIIHRKDFKIYFKKQVQDFTVEEKILVYALAKKLMTLEGFFDSEEISAKEIILSFGIPEGSVYPAFKNLKKSNFLVGSGSSYIVSNYKVGKIIEQFKEKYKSK